MAVVPMMTIKRFYTDYKPDKKDPAKLIGVDMVEYGPIGSIDKSLVTTTISSLRNVLPMSDRSNPAVVAAFERWEFIRPRYEAWKAGQEAPVEGTPLAAWNAITPEQAEVLKRNGVRTVEELSQLTDAHIERFPIANMRTLITQARQFLDASDATRFAKQLADKERMIENQAIELADQREQTKALMAKVEQLAELVANSGQPAADEDEPVAGQAANPVAPKRRGRPPKAVQAA